MKTLSQAIKTISGLTDQNQHWLSLKEGCIYLGLTSLAKQLQDGNDWHIIEGYLTGKLSIERQKLAKEMFSEAEKSLSEADLLEFEGAY